MENIYSKENLLQQIKDMGFSEEQFNIAFQRSQNKSLEGLIAWMDENNALMEQELNKLQIQQQQQQSNTQQAQSSQPQQQEQNQSQQSQNQEENKMDIEQVQQQQPQQQQQPELQQQSISTFINQDYVKILQEMSYSKKVAEKALFLTGGQNLIHQSVEKAIEWINQHKNDADFEEELFIVGQAETQQQPKYSEEERKIKALELQERLRKQREEKEKRLQIEQEQNRVKSGKLMTQAAREQEEANQKRHMEEFKRQKQQDELDKQKILAQLEKDKAERLGQKYVEQQKAAQMRPPIQKIEIGIKQMKVAQPEHLYPGLAKNALSTIKIYLENIAKNPSEEKFKKINLSNEKFQEKVGKSVTGIAILKEVGFEEENGFLIMKNVNLDLVKQTIQKIISEL